MYVVIHYTQFYFCFESFRNGELNGVKECPENYCNLSFNMKFTLFYC